jgi:diguanylate cyclase (GGDEF)-like protein
MADAPTPEHVPSLIEQVQNRTARGNHFSCSMTAVLVARVYAFGGDEAVAELLRLAGSERSVHYLTDITNWISYDEAVALWEGGARVTHHPDFARVVGEDAARRLNGSQVAALLRSLGSPENVYRQIATTATKFATVTRMAFVDGGPGYAEIIAAPVEGFPRNSQHCAWTTGLLTQPTVLFGLSPAMVEHEECAALGAERCRYRIIWNAQSAKATTDSSEQVVVLREQLEAMRERLQSVFATASDLIAADEIDDVLARITDRAAVEVRAPRYLLAVHLTPGGELHCHHKGFDEGTVAQFAQRILTQHPAAHPDSWLVVPVRSNRQDYGRLLAMYEHGSRFFPQERELLEVYARYAASALDGAAALMEAKQRYDQSSALLDLARALAVAGTSGEIARRLADAVPLVVDCDRVGVYLWDAAKGELTQRATNRGDGAHEDVPKSRLRVPGGPLEQLLADPNQEPMLIDSTHGDPRVYALFAEVGAVATIVVPLATADSLLGLLSVSVSESAERLKPNPDLLDRLSGVAAQATTALQNGRLVDQITYQALHDQLTGLANRLQFTEDLRSAVTRARHRSELVTLFYLDLDGFKPVNDEFGHDIGDHLLVAVGKRLTACTRASDVVARLGGDEFAVLIDAHASPQDADIVAGRLAEAFDDPFLIDGNTLRLGASIGRAVFPTDSDSTDGLLRRADAAMFECKRAAGESGHLSRGR